jgi:hypothetical protein
MPEQRGTPQLGGSQRGPGTLDDAKRNQGRPEEDVTFKDEDPEGLAAGETADEQERRRHAARAPGLGGSEGRRPGETPVHGPDEVDEAEAARSAQPGGDRPSESERPDRPRSRWGAGPDGQR